MGTSTMKTKRAAVSGVPAAASAHEEIATRAYLYYQERGELPGHDLDDWLLAERAWLEEHRDVVIAEIADE